MMRVEMLPAQHGDCLLVECGNDADVHRVLVDTGPPSTWKSLRARLDALPRDQRHIDLLVITHIDADHIGSVVRLLDDDALGVTFGDIWFNGFRHLPAPPADRGVAQAEVLTDRLTAGRDGSALPWNKAFDGDAVRLFDDGSSPVVTLPFGLTLTLLSPTRDRLAKLRPTWQREIARLEAGASSDQTEQRRRRDAPSRHWVEDAAATKSVDDVAAPNGSSIAFLAEFGGAAGLFGADAHPDVLSTSLAALAAHRGVTRLSVDAFKLPHHASQANVTTALLDTVTARDYLVSTNGAYFDHPDRAAIARVVLSGDAGKRLVFNYSSRYTDVWSDAATAERYGYTAVYPEEGDSGVAVVV